MNKRDSTKYPEHLKKAWILQDMEKALELIFRDFSLNLQRGMDIGTQQEFFDLIMNEIEELGFKNDLD